MKNSNLVIELNTSSSGMTVGVLVWGSSGSAWPTAARTRGGPVRRANRRSGLGLARKRGWEWRIRDCEEKGRHEQVQRGMSLGLGLRLRRDEEESELVSRGWAMRPSWQKKKKGNFFLRFVFRTLFTGFNVYLSRFHHCHLLFTYIQCLLSTSNPLFIFFLEGFHPLKPPFSHPK